MVDIPLTLSSRTDPMPQLTASKSSRSQRLNCSNPLTHSLNCTALQYLNRTRSVEWYSLREDHVEKTDSHTTFMVGRGPLPSNGSSIFAYLRSYCIAIAVASLFKSRSLPSNGSIYHNILKEPAMAYLKTVLQAFDLKRLNIWRLLPLFIKALPDRWIKWDRILNFNLSPL
jgi:hypothetical protein